MKLKFFLVLLISTNINANSQQCLDNSFLGTGYLSKISEVITTYNQSYCQEIFDVIAKKPDSNLFKRAKEWLAHSNWSDTKINSCLAQIDRNIKEPAELPQESNNSENPFQNMGTPYLVISEYISKKTGKNNSSIDSLSNKELQTVYKDFSKYIFNSSLNDLLYFDPEVYSFFGLEKKHADIFNCLHSKAKLVYTCKVLKNSNSETVQAAFKEYLKDFYALSKDATPFVQPTRICQTNF